MGTEIRRIFGETVDAVGPLLAEPALAERWEEPSALAHMAVSGLAGHLLRATALVEAYLDRPEPDDPGVRAIEPATYLVRALTDDDLDSPLHRSIRRRGEETAAGGPAALRGRWDEVAVTLGRRLPGEPAGRLVSVLDGLVLTLDDYLRTRLVELCVHADDLAVSLAVPTPEVPAAATDIATGVLIDVARLRHGSLAVLRALARRERDASEALRVL